MYELLIIAKHTNIRYRYKSVFRHWVYNENLHIATTKDAYTHSLKQISHYEVVSDKEEGSLPYRFQDMADLSMLNNQQDKETIEQVPNEVIEKLHKDDLERPSVLMVLSHMLELQTLLWAIPGARKIAVSMAVLKFVIYTIRDLRKNN